jgi:hypothetical protein
VEQEGTLGTTVMVSVPQQAEEGVTMQWNFVPCWDTNINAQGTILKSQNQNKIRRNEPFSMFAGPYHQPVPTRLADHYRGSREPISGLMCNFGVQTYLNPYDKFDDS